VRAFNDRRAVTALGMVFGDVSVAVGDEQGNVASWFPVRSEGAQRLTRVHELSRHDGPVREIIPSERNKALVSRDETGRVHLDCTTSERHLLSIEGERPLRLTGYAPRGNAMIGLDDRGRLGLWNFDWQASENSHPEVSWKTLLGKVHYENHDEPKYIWQSSGTDEPKLSLVPVIVVGAALAIWLCGPLEGWLFDGDFRQWIYSASQGDLSYEQLNSLVVAFGLGFAVLYNGLGVYWADPLELVELADGAKLLGEEVERESDPHSEVERVKYHVDNREFGSAFRWVDLADVRDVSYPEDAMKLDRTENLNYIGFLEGIETPGLDVPEADSPGRHRAVHGPQPHERPDRIRPHPADVHPAGPQGNGRLRHGPVRVVGPARRAGPKIKGVVISVHLEREIGGLKKRLRSLCAVVEDQVQMAVRSLLQRDVEMAQGVESRDRDIDQQEIDVEEDCLKILALHQPVAADLRTVVSALKINNDLERIADLATNIAEDVIYMIQGRIVRHAEGD